MNEKPSPYLELLKVVLTDYYPQARTELHALGQLRQTWKVRGLQLLDSLLRSRNFSIQKAKTVLPEVRANGYDWPGSAYTMIGMHRLTNIEQCIRSILQNRVSGDLVEAGVWRGGAVMFMKAVLREWDVHDRKIWAADSFRGMPKPRPSYAADRQNTLYLEKILVAGLQEVKNNMARFDLLDEDIVFLEGWFQDTLPKAGIERIALLRLDADMYESTSLALQHLYHKVSIGGFIIVDVYHAFAECKLAVDEFRAQHGCTEPLQMIDKEAVCWQKAGTTNAD